MKKTVKAPGSVGQEVIDDVIGLLGNPATLDEDETFNFDETLRALAHFVRPTDVIAWILMRDLAESRVEIMRFRKMKLELMKRPRRQYLERQANAWSDPTKVIEELEAAAEKKKADLGAAVTADCVEHDAKYDAIEADLKAQIIQVQEKYAGNRRYWKELPITETDLANYYGVWRENVESVERLLHFSEQRFQIGYGQLGAHLNGMAQRRWDKVIEGEVVQGTERFGNGPIQRRGTGATRRPGAVRPAAVKEQQGAEVKLKKGTG